MRFDIASVLDMAPTLRFADVNLVSVIYSAYTYENFVLIWSPYVQRYFMPFEQKILGITSFFALYLDKSIAPVHAFFISFLSLKRYYSIILFIILCAWSQGIERGNVSTVRVTFGLCPCTVCEFVPKYLQRLHSCFPENGSGIGLKALIAWWWVGTILLLHENIRIKTLYNLYKYWK